MGNEQSAKNIAIYINEKLGMLPRTAEMAASRYVALYCRDRNKPEIEKHDQGDFGDWLAEKLFKSGIIEKDRIQKLIDDFNDQRNKIL